MSIENGITKLADAIGTLAQAGFAIASGIDRYCDLSQDQAVSTGGDAEMKEVINKAVAEFEAEHEEHKAKAEVFKTTPEVEKEVHEAEGFKTEEVAEAEPVAEEVSEEAESDKPVTFEEAKSVVIDAVSTKGKPAVAAIFKQLGAKNLPGLEPSQYGELVALCKAA